MAARGRTHYETLGVAPDATAAQVKSAFRRAAKTHHPDAGGSEEDFKALNEAYETLSDPERRREYDAQLRFGGTGRTGPGRQPGSRPAEADFDFSGFSGTRFAGTGMGDLLGDQDLSDILGGLFGTAAGPRKRDLRYEVVLGFEQAFAGTEVDTPAGRVRLPAGLSDGGTVRFPGRGEPGPAGPGDLYVTVRLRPHPHFSRDGADVLLTLPLAPAEAALGTEVSIPTPDGKRARLRVPAGTAHGKKFRLRGKGAPGLSGKRPGDLVVTAEVVVPKTLTDAERKAYETLLPAGPGLRGHLA